MNDELLNTMTSATEETTAIILHGLFRTAELTATSFNKNVSEYLNADVFYCGYKYSDKPLVNHAGIHDKFGFMKDNPKNTTDIDNSKEITAELLNKLYGNRLKSYVLHSVTPDDLLSELDDIEANEILFQLNPARFLSIFYNIEKAYRLIEDYERENGFIYDNIIIARPDLAFYSKIDISKLKQGNLLVPSGMGLHPHTGVRNYGMVEPLYYKNVLMGTCIPTGMQFNDQLIAIKRCDASILRNLLSDCKFYIKSRVPLTPETILYFHFNSVHRINIIPTDKWLYEIFRIGAPIIENITDIPMLERFDPHHPIVREKAKKNRVKYALKNIRRNFFYYRNKITTLIKG